MCSTVFSYRLQRGTQQLTSVGLICHPVTAEQRQRLAEFQPVTLYCTQDGLLFGSRNGAQCMGECGTDRAVVKLLLGQQNQLVDVFLFNIQLLDCRAGAI